MFQRENIDNLTVKHHNAIVICIVSYFYKKIDNYFANMSDKMSNKKVLLLTCDKDFVGIVVDLVKCKQNKIFISNSIDNFISYVRKYDIDLAILDIEFGVIECIKLIRYINIEQPRMFCMLLADLSELNDIIDANYEINIFQILTKPVATYEVNLKISFVLEYFSHFKKYNSLKSLYIDFVEIEKKFPGITSLPEIDEYGYYIVDL